MNAKLCKAMRRAARRETVGRPLAEYHEVRNPPSPGRRYPGVTIRLTPTCTKGYYRRMKKIVAKQGWRK